MTASLHPRRGPRHTFASLASGEVPEALRSFRRMTEGLSGRLRLPSLQSMRAGVVRTPHSLALAFLQAGRRAGLNQAWAEQLVLFVRQAIDTLWGPDPLPLKEARRRALIAESVENATEQSCLQDGEDIPRLIAERDAVEREVEADTARLTSLNARIRAGTPPLDRTR